MFDKTRGEHNESVSPPNCRHASGHRFSTFSARSRRAGWLRFASSFRPFQNHISIVGWRVAGEKGMFSFDIRDLLLLIAEATVLGLIPAVLAAQTDRGFVRWWIYGSLLSLAVRVIFIIAGWLLSYVLWTPRA